MASTVRWGHLLYEKLVNMNIINMNIIAALQDFVIIIKYMFHIKVIIGYILMCIA